MVQMRGTSSAHITCCEEKPVLLRVPIACPSSVGRKKNLNNFRTEAATHLVLAIIGKLTLKRLKKYSHSKLQNWRESAIPKLNTKVYGNRATHTRILSRGSVQSITCKSIVCMRLLGCISLLRLVNFIPCSSL